MAYCNPNLSLDSNPHDQYFWTYMYNKVSFFASLSLILLLITAPLKPRIFLLISMLLAAMLTLSDDHARKFNVYVRKLISVVVLACIFRFFLWCAGNLRRFRFRITARTRNRGGYINDDGRSSVSVYLRLGVLGIFALVDSMFFLMRCVQKVQRIMRGGRRRRRPI